MINYWIIFDLFDCCFSRSILNHLWFIIRITACYLFTDHYMSMLDSTDYFITTDYANYYLCIFVLQQYVEMNNSHFDILNLFQDQHCVLTLWLRSFRIHHQLCFHQGRQAFQALHHHHCNHSCSATLASVALFADLIGFGTGWSKILASRYSNDY